MIPIRLPWRPRARPSATLHEIPACSMKSKLEEKPTTDRAVCQEIFDRGSSTEASSPFVRVLKSSKGMSGRRRADGFKPTADIDLGVRLAAIVPRMRRIGCLFRPFEYR